MKTESIEENFIDDRQYAVACGIAAVLNLQYMEKKHNLDEAAISLRQALARVNKMQRHAKCGKPIPYVVKNSKGAKNANA